MRLTVIIPTYNRSDLLGRCLRSLLDQTLLADQYEIVVVDDGSTDTTPQVVAEVGAPESRLRYFRQENQGPAAARNYGGREAKGEIVFFTGDDCLADKRLLEEHLRAHAQESDVGVIGHVAWHPELEVTAFMTFLEGGVQFGFGCMDDPENVSFQNFYTANCSVRKSWLEAVGGFDEDFPYAAYEDIEIAYRMQKRGLRFIYRPAARTYHHHATTLERYLVRQRLVGRSAVLFARKHPELEEQLGIQRAAMATSVIRLYEAVVEYARELGIRDALRYGPPAENEVEALWRDPEMAQAGQDWIREVFRDNDPGKAELIVLWSDLTKLQKEWKLVSSRRLYRWSEWLAKCGWRILKKLGYRQRLQENTRNTRN